MKRKILVAIAVVCSVGAALVVVGGIHADQAKAWHWDGPECVGVSYIEHPDCIPPDTTPTDTTPTDTTPTDTTSTETTPTETVLGTTTTSDTPKPPVEAGTTPKAEKAARRAKAVANSPGNESLQVAQLGG